MFSSIISSLIRVTKKIKIPGGSVSLGFSAKQTQRNTNRRAPSIRTR